MKPERLWSAERHGAAVLACILAVVVLVPVPLGSNRPYAWFGLEVFVFSVLALWALGALFHANRRLLSWSRARILVVLACWLFLIYLQSVELPERAVEALSPVSFSLQGNLELLNITARNTLSVDPAGTYNELLKYGCYAALFGLTMLTVTTRRRLLALLGVIIAAGGAQAVFGIFTRLTGFVIFPESGAAAEPRMGTFVNPDHFAVMLVMVFGLIVGLLTAMVGAGTPGHGPAGGRREDARIPLPAALLAAAGAVLLAAIVASGSTGPAIAAGIALLIMFGVAESAGRLDKRQATLVLGAVAVLAATVVLESAVRDRDGLFFEDALAAEWGAQNAAGLELLSKVWMTGVGAGNYRWVFPMFRDEDLRFVTYDYAHNDYLQAAIEQGVPAALLLAAAILLIVRELCRGYRSRRDPLMRGVIFGCLTAVLFMLVYSLVGFSFHIPASSVYFFVIAAAGIAACRVDRGKKRRGPDETEREDG